VERPVGEFPHVGAVLEARARLADRGIDADVMRLKAFPFGPEVLEFLEAHREIFVVEQNRDGQLRSLLPLETEFPLARMTSVRSYGGMPLSAREVVDAVAAAASSGGAQSGRREPGLGREVGAGDERRPAGDALEGVEPAAPRSRPSQRRKRA